MFAWEGSFSTSEAGPLIRVDNEPLLSTRLVDGSVLLLSLDLYDRDDHLLVSIVENEWVSHVPLPWDVEFNGWILMVRSAPRSISFTLNTEPDPLVITGKLWRKGRLLEISETGLHAGEAHMIGGSTLRGWVIDLDSTASTGFSLVPQPLQPPPNARQPKIGRNERCPCGSGQKYKFCHGR